MADSLEIIFVGGIKDGFFFGWTVFGIFAVWCVVLFICRKIVQESFRITPFLGFESGSHAI